MGQTLRRRVGLLAVLAIMMTIAMTSAPFARAQEESSEARPAATPIAVPAAEDGSITITARMCPEEYAGDDYQADCADVPPAGTEFHTLNQGNPGEPIAIDGNGVAVLPLPAADTPGAIVLSFTLPGYYHDVHSAVSCADAEGTPLPVSDAGGPAAVEIPTDGMAISCAWRLIPDRIGPAGLRRGELRDGLWHACS
ncbi:MAG: hypothetical protein ACRDJH_26850 [Thermomicrobiales bacterium]